MCTRCLDFFFVTHTLWLCSAISYNSIHYTYLAHTHIHIVGYTYATYLVYAHTYKHIQTYTYAYSCAYLRITYAHLHTGSILLFSAYIHTELLPTPRTHLCTAAQACSHTVYVIHLHRDTHSHTKVNNNSIIHIDMYKRY